LGYSAGSGINGGDYNTIIGSYTGGSFPINTTGSNYIVLSDGQGNIGLMVDPSSNVGIGTSGPTVPSKLGVYGGNIQIGTSTHGLVFPDGSFMTNAGAIAIVSETAPAAPAAGQIWYKSDEGKLYIYYVDDDSSQWVGVTASIMGGPGAGGVSEYIKISDLKSLVAASTDFANFQSRIASL
jgi:hypothetical protein